MKKTWLFSSLGSKLCAAIMAGVFLSGCVIGVTRYPKDGFTAPLPEKTDQKAYYHIHGVTLAGGHHALREAFPRLAPFSRLEWAEIPPETGLHISVKIRNIPPTLPALVFGYISLGTLTLTPAWTTKGGSDLVFEIRRDGKVTQTYLYPIRRAGVLWIVTLPLIWVNLFTPSEARAFEAAARKFFSEAGPVLTGGRIP